ncbi:RimJ/RimL family protein N-acetyltransferase [Actinocorallia herbida]|uniref:RimJ/RimL family protein N-acetyltransferase n=1 Tax=Actinocorallia herbida TaxID=58109 RepID=A0A3N1CYL1_9ACTN|nr:GNAT family protein [Actinocorallia herbida]ROO86373.1 RimJ/RimL family protein N-acetyltransferase [Actinocorallia herbida]
MPLNAHGQPIGDPLPGWEPRRPPGPVVLEGTRCRVEPLDPARHAADLHAAYRSAPDDRDWTYLTAGPFATAADYRAWADGASRSADPRHYAVVATDSGQAVGTLALMRQDPAHGVIEVGGIAFSPPMRRSPLSTEAQFLLMSYVFDTLGYRRYEWKCDSLNAPSRAAAERLGFTFEGVFRQAVVYKGRNRDTAWYSLLDREWPAAKRAFRTWLAPANHTPDGRQIQPLAALRTPGTRTATEG